MARDKMFDPAYQKCFTEAILRENKIRMNWYHKYGTRNVKGEAVIWDDDPLDDDDLSEDETFEDESTCRTEQRRRMPSKEELTWPASRAPTTRTIPRVSQPPEVMKPVPKKVKKFLYQGLSHDGEGRAQYLRRRYRDSPEERYFFPVCSSWEYGWTYGIDPISTCPVHGQRRA